MQYLCIVGGHTPTVARHKHRALAERHEVQIAHLVAVRWPGGDVIFLLAAVEDARACYVVPCVPKVDVQVDLRLLGNMLHTKPQQHAAYETTTACCTTCKQRIARCTWHDGVCACWVKPLRQLWAVAHEPLCVAAVPCPVTQACRYARCNTFCQHGDASTGKQHLFDCSRKTHIFRTAPSTQCVPASACGPEKQTL